MVSVLASQVVLCLGLNRQLLRFAHFQMRSFLVLEAEAEAAVAVVVAELEAEAVVVATVVIYLP